MRRIDSLALTAITVVLAGCGGGGGGGGQLAVELPLPAIAAGQYLQVGQVALADLDAALAAAGGLTATQVSGPAMQVVLGADKVLRYLGPLEQHRDTVSTVRLVSGGRAWMLPFEWTTRLGPALSRVQEANEDGTPQADDGVTVAIEGVGAAGVVSAETSMLRAVVSGVAGLDPALTIISLNTVVASEAVTGWFSADAAAGAFTIDPDQLGVLLSRVKTAKRATLTFSVSTEDYEHSYVFEQALVYSAGRLRVSVVDSTGAPSSTRAKAQFVLRGFNSGASRLIPLDDAASATIDGLNADTFELHEVRLEPGTPLTGFATISKPDGTADLTITEAAPPASAAQGAPTAAYTATVRAGAADTLVAAPVEYTIPRGTAKVHVRIDILTDEYPEGVRANSQFNDVWQFNLSLPTLSAPLAQTGKVNQSHAQGELISFDRCLDVSAAAAAADLQITGTIGVQNVADGLLATEVTAAIALSCDDDLIITSFAGRATAADGGLILTPRVAAAETSPDGNVAGQYLSMPLAARLPEGFGIPATLEWGPASATITELELFQRRGGTDTSLGKEYLAQGEVGAGRVTFAGLRLEPTASLTPTTERVAIVAVLRGTADGAPVASKPFPLSIDRYTSFTPLYLASELPAYAAARRYPANDEPGGDAWATAAMLQWLAATPLVYNDLSAAHVAQDPTQRRSVLGHSGHGDGQQVDVRYGDGAGGFTSPLNGAGAGAAIAQLAADAQAEVAAGTTTGPKLAQLQAWITANRSTIGAYAARTEVRRVYVGSSFIAVLLLRGEFPGRNPRMPIPGVTAWPSPSPKILPEDNHLDHWHISANRP